MLTQLPSDSSGRRLKQAANGKMRSPERFSFMRDARRAGGANQYVQRKNQGVSASPGDGAPRAFVGYFDREEIRIENAADEFDRLQQQQNREVAIRNLDRQSKLL